MGLFNVINEQTMSNCATAEGGLRSQYYNNFAKILQGDSSYSDAGTTMCKRFVYDYELQLLRSEVSELVQFTEKTKTGHFGQLLCYLHRPNLYGG